MRYEKKMLLSIMHQNDAKSTQITG